MIDTHKYIQLSIVHEQDLQHALNQCSEVSVPLPQSLVFSLEQLSVKIMTDDDTEKTKTINALCQIVAYWPDSSFKWVKLTYQYFNQPQLYLNIVKDHGGNSGVTIHKSIDGIDVSGVSNEINNYSYKGGNNTLSLSLADNRLEMLDQKGEAILSLTSDD
jgi:hypothetical protein